MPTLGDEITRRARGAGEEMTQNFSPAICNSLLITGGTGSLGRAFARHALESGVQRVCIFSRGEHTQEDMRQEFGNDRRLRFFIGDVRDQPRLRRAMEGCGIIVHAAALKTIQAGFYNPSEMVKTNILGAINVIEAAHDAYVQKVVAISSDKAYQAISPYGQSKALAESLFIAADYARGRLGPRFAVCRYGNVAGSRGSVIPKWQELISAGATWVPITDPECTRFYMKMSEAAELVGNTINTMNGGELVIPELPAYRLGDLAEAMGVEYKVTGLPQYEKLHECMADGNCSNTARRMSVTELKEEVGRV